jgi:hypothetical protein
MFFFKSRREHELQNSRDLLLIYACISLASILESSAGNTDHTKLSRTFRAEAARFIKLIKQGD